MQLASAVEVENGVEGTRMSVKEISEEMLKKYLMKITKKYLREMNKRYMCCCCVHRVPCIDDAVAI